MPSIVLRKITQPEQISSGDILNLSSPLSYKDWLAQHFAIIPNDAQKQYDRYLQSFYTNKNNTTAQQLTNIKNDYIALVKKLSSIFKFDEEFQRFAKIDFDSAAELKMAIPFYARKLKEIAVYYINHRDKIKQNKIEYSSIGSEFGLERFLYKNLLNLFTNKPFADKGLYTSNAPDLSGITNNFSISIEELYDTTNYSEEESLDINPLFCVLDGYVSNICTQLNDISSDINNKPLESIFLCESDNLNINDLIRAGWEKYLGNDLYYISGGSINNNLIDVSLALQTGDNFFYWFSGENVNEIPNSIYENISLSSLDWTNATAAGHFSASDLIFVNYGNLKTEAAWLMSASNYTANVNMTATIIDGREFKFPYPGIGLSAEGGEWTGRLITDTYKEDKRFFPNEISYQNNQQEIEKLYWNATLTNSSVIPMNIQSLNLEDCGAYASNKFNTADKLIVRSNTAPYTIDDSTPNGVFTGDLNIAWLYKFNQTQIPVKNGTTNIYYPLTSFDNLSQLYFEYESGNTLALSAISVNESFAGAVAGESIEQSDMIIRLKAPCGPEIEGAWLKGVPLKYTQNIFLNDYKCGENDLVQYYTDWNYVSGATQPGVSFIADNGNYVRFVWTGNNTDINEFKGFQGFTHDPACPYTQLDQNSSILDVNFLTVNDTARYEKWRKCTCKSVYYSPLGHKGNDLIYKGITPDFIVPDTQPDKNFNLIDWRGSDNKSYLESNDLIRFKPYNLLEKDIGWSKGEWVRPSGEKFIFETGKSYIFYRTNLDSCNYTLPPFVINQGYVDSNIKQADCAIIDSIPVWYKASLDSNGNWIDTGLKSDMQLQSGNFYNYIHRPEYLTTKQKLLYSGLDVTSISGNYITLYRDDANISYKTVTFSTPSVDFLIKIPLKNNRGYWGEASYNTKEFLSQRDTNQYRYFNDYLQLTQPVPSNLTLGEQTVIKYELSECNKCFSWVQPVSIQVDEPSIHWNKIDMDNCVYSDILNYMHERSNKECNSYTPICYSDCQAFSVCGCGDYCEPVKTGVTATNIPIDITLNNQISGLPVFINYHARNNYNLNFTVKDLAAKPIEVPPLTGLLAKATAPWNNLLNDQTVKILYKQIDNNLMNHQQLGLMIPSNLSVGKFELSNAVPVKENSSNVIDAIRKDKYDYPFVPTQINSKSYKNNKGVPVIKGKQSYHPYSVKHTDVSEFNNKIKEWYSDIYGNLYYFLNTTENNQIGSLYIKDELGDLYKGLDYLANIYNKYKAFNMSGVLEGAIATEDGYLLTTEDGYVLIIS